MLDTLRFTREWSNRLIVWSTNDAPKTVLRGECKLAQQVSPSPLTQAAKPPRQQPVVQQPTVKPLAQAPAKPIDPPTIQPRFGVDISQLLQAAIQSTIQVARAAIQPTLQAEQQEVPAAPLVVPMQAQTVDTFSTSGQIVQVI